MSALPHHAQDVGLVRVLVAEFTLVGMVHGIADGARHAHRGRGNQDIAILLLQRQDAPQGMILFLAPFDVAGEAQDLVAMLFLERPAQRQIDA